MTPATPGGGPSVPTNHRQPRLPADPRPSIGQVPPLSGSALSSSSWLSERSPRTSTGHPAAQPPDPALSAVNHQLRIASSPLEGDLPASGRTMTERQDGLTHSLGVTMHDTRRLAQSAVDQIEVGLPAVSLVVLPTALDPVAVLADGRGEALVERLALAPELPLAVADAHLVDAADVPVVGVELVVAAVGGVAAVDTDAVGRLRHLHGRTLEQKLAALQPFKGALGLTRPRLAAGWRRRLAPLTDQHLELLERLLRSRLIHDYPFPAHFLGLYRSGQSRHHH